MNSTFLRVLSLSLGLLTVLSGCDVGGMHPLWNPRDSLVGCGSDATTWIRTTETGTQLLTVGARSPELATLGEGTCFLLTEIDTNSSTRSDVGSYTYDGTNGTFTNTFDYGFVYEPEKSLLERRGSFTNELKPATAHAVSFARTATGLDLTMDGETTAFESILDVYDRLAGEPTEESAKDLFRMFNLALLHSQVRIQAFGSKGMTSYMGASTDFGGAISSYFTLASPATKPHVDITYFDFVELEGSRVDGLQATRSNLAGRGTMFGVLTTEFRGKNSTTRIEVDYIDCLIERGIGAGGTYTLTVPTAPGSPSFVIPYTIASDTCPSDAAVLVH